MQYQSLMQSVMRHFFILCPILLFLSLFARPIPQAYAGWIQSHYSDLRGARDYSVYLPSSHTDMPRPLLLFLQGCNESAQEFAQGARIAEFAESRGYLVLLPTQDARSNPERCWNWFLPIDQMRDSGEEGLLSALTLEVSKTYGGDSSRIFVAGLSAGGAMANILASCHPDLFSAAAIHSGMPFRAASDPASALWSVAHGSTMDPSWAGVLAYQCSGLQRQRMPLILIQGTEDQRVVPRNAEQILEGYAAFNDWMDDGWANGSVNLDRPRIEKAQVPGGYSYSVRSFFSGNRILLKSVTVNGMAHAWSGGDPRFPHTDTKGPDFTRMMFDFFEETRQ